MADLRAGAGVAAIELPDGTAMGGFAARAAASSGALDPLTARAIALENGSDRIALVVLDTLYATDDIVGGVRATALGRHGIAAERILISATHTHSGPRDIRSAAPVPVVDAVVAAAAAALDGAVAALRPARVLRTETGGVGLARQRRNAPDRHRDVADVLVFEAMEHGAPTGTTIAVLAGYACHPVVLDHRSLALSADFPATARATVEAAVGGTAVFLQGFSGDLNPMVIDHSPADARRAGALVGGAVAGAAAEVLGVERDLHVIDLSLSAEVPASVRRGRVVDATPLAGWLDDVTADPRDPRAEASGADPAAREAERWVADLIAEGSTVFESMDVFHGSPGPVSLPVQALRIGDLLLVAFPGEPFSDSAAELRASLPGWDLISVGYANRAVAYLPTAAEFARSGYEVGCCAVAPGSAERLVAAVVDRFGGRVTA